jgi:hypothetical protein
MQELDIGTLIAVFEEIFGPLVFWAMVAVAAVVTVLFVYVVVRDRAILSARFLRAELLAPIGAVAAVWFVLYMTDSTLTDIGGPIDVIVIMLIALAGAVGFTLLAYVALALIFGPRRRSGREAGSRP